MNRKGFTLAWTSCGVTSAVAGKLAIDNNPNTKFYYMEIDSHHPDNERFLKDLEQWYGVSINRVRSEKYRDQFDVISDTGYVNGPEGARCTLELKKKVRFKLEDSFKPDLFNQEKEAPINSVHGFEWKLSEINRALDYAMDYSYTNPIFPLIENKLTKENCAKVLLDNGIKLPAMYELGYNNNNCIGCVKGGMGYWNKIRTDFPDHFNRMAKIERDAGHSCIKDVFLDELDPSRGRMSKPIIPSCSVVCADIAPEELNLDLAKKVWFGKVSMKDAVSQLKY